MRKAYLVSVLLCIRKKLPVAGSVGAQRRMDMLLSIALIVIAGALILRMLGAFAIDLSYKKLLER